MAKSSGLKNAPSTGYTVSGGTVEREVSLSNDGAVEVNLSIKK
jgi:flagellar basal body P-ring protein FlgI